MPNKAVIWLNDDSLRADHPVFDAAGGEVPAVYVWDDDHLRESGFSLKRLVFIYETLVELPVQIVRGNTREILASLGAAKIYVPETIDPFVKSVARDLSATIEFVVVQDEPFVDILPGKSWKRFYQYWNQAEKAAFRLDATPQSALLL